MNQQGSLPKGCKIPGGSFQGCRSSTMMRGTGPYAAVGTGTDLVNRCKAVAGELRTVVDMDDQRNVALT